ncbi:MAG: hypothetical protein FWG29_10620 [Treponema sp.]|nr:hypothetical protein [Treponema sp.]
MKKTIAALLFVMVATGAFGQSFLNLRIYGIYFNFQNGIVNVTSNYIMSAPRTDRRTFGDLGGEQGIDTPLEFALLSYYSDPVKKIRPVEADKILPADNPRLSGLKLGAATYKELVEIRYLDPRNTDRIGRYEEMLRFISSKSNVTRAEIETYYRDNIRAFIAEVVDEEFGKISFTSGSPTGGYNAVLMRNPQNGHYTLRYTDARNNTKELSANSLDALKTAMARNTAEFNQNGVNTVSTQNALIPAVSNIGRQSTEPTVLITNILTGLYTATTTAERDRYFKALLGQYIRYQQLVNAGEGIKAVPALHSFADAVIEMSPGLFSKFGQDIQRINVFNVRFTSTSKDEIEVLASWRQPPLRASA